MAAIAGLVSALTLVRVDITPAGAADPAQTVQTSKTGTFGSIEEVTTTSGINQVTMVAGLIATAPTTSDGTSHGSDDSTTAVAPLPYQSVYFSVEAQNGIWYPLCNQTTNAGGMAGCSAEAPYFMLQQTVGGPYIKQYYVLSAWSAAYQGGTQSSVTYGSSSDYGLIPGAPAPAPTPPDNGGIEIVPQRYASGCKPQDPNAPGSFLDIFTDGGNCNLVALEKIAAPFAMGFAAIVTGGLVVLPVLLNQIASVAAIFATTFVPVNIIQTSLIGLTGIAAASLEVLGPLAGIGLVLGTVSGGLLANYETTSIGPTGDLQIGTGGTLENDGVLNNNGTIQDASSSSNGAGTIVNHGTIVNNGTIPNNGQGGGGLLITANNYTLNFDLAGPGNPPSAMHVFAPTVTASQQSLPTPSDPGSAKVFTGWYTAAEGGTAVANDTDLSALLPTGPSSTTLYAHFVARSDLGTATTASGATTTYSTAAQNVSLTAHVVNSAGPVAEGNVIFTLYNGSNQTVATPVTAPIGEGTASTLYALPAGLAAGTYRVQANYSDPGGLNEISGDGVPNVVVAQAPTTTTGAVSTVYSGDTQDIPVTAQVSSSVATVDEGTVTFTLEDGNQAAVTASAPVANGTAATVLPVPAGLLSGTYSILGTYRDMGGNFGNSSDIEPGGLPQSVVLPNPLQNFVVGRTWSPSEPFSLSIFNDVLYSGLDPASTGCTWDGFTLKFFDVGTCLLDATFPAADGYAATPVQLRVPIGPAENVYEVQSWPGSNVAVGSTFTPKVTSVSGLPATLSIDPSSTGGCSVYNGTLMFNSVGVCYVDFTTPTTSKYFGGTYKYYYININLDPQGITFIASPPAVVGGSYPVWATSDSSQTVSLSVDPASARVCTITGNTVTYARVGSCVVDGAVASSGNYAAGTASETITVGKAQPTITFSAPPDDAAVGGTYAVSATASSGAPVALKVDATTRRACSLGAGTVTFTHAGSCQIDGSVKASGGSARVTASQTIAVAKPVPLQITSATPNSGPVAGGTPIDIIGTGFAAGDQVVIGQGRGARTDTIAATQVTIVSPTEITAVTGGGAKAGTFTVYVINTSGKVSKAVADVRFTYRP
ncbi:MAG TPA: IPT/TIG domain-containing protein [Acidimicrobiia bacterium]|nr:IPT/TIG domain-containing protein [Acidimicrobiia bacterium]